MCGDGAGVVQERAVAVIAVHLERLAARDLGVANLHVLELQLLCEQRLELAPALHGCRRAHHARLRTNSKQTRVS